MSDRVRFGTWNDTVTPASSSGFNGFILPRPDVATVSDDPKFTMTFAEVIEFVWRVKKFRWKCSVTWQIDVTPNREYYSIVYDQTLARNRTTESSLPNTFSYDLLTNTPAVTVNVTFEDGSPPSSFADTLSISGSVDFALDTEDWTFSFDWGARVASTDPTPGTVVGSMSFLGGTYDLYGPTIALPTAHDIAFTASSFEVVEYWPYAALDASPIYNTTTGAQLQSPLN